MIHRVIQALLQATAEKSIGPTYTTRNLFLCSSLLYNAQTYWNPSFTTFDNYPKSSSVVSSRFAIYLTTLCAEIGLPLIISNSSAIQTFLTSDDLFTSSKYIEFKRIRSLQPFRVALRSAIESYLTLRSADGVNSSNVQLSTTDLPNGEAVIDPDAVIDFSTFADPLKWTPLKVNTYLTPQWGEVRGFLEESKVEEYHTFVERFLNEVDFPLEVRHVLDVSQSLDDKQMCIAEFWAGGKNTITPPGFWNLFLVSYYSKQSGKSSISDEARSFLILNSALFQTSIVVWGIKRAHFQARPIQTIRYYYPNETLNYYFGEGISSSLWKPYQPDTFVTPPFPDFISGHSTFSAVGARILSRLIGNNLLDLDLSIDASLAPLFSPLFYSDSESANVEDQLFLHCFTIFPRTSSVSTPEAYPTKAVQMTYNTWDDMAIEAGVSRIYGGIHYESSNYSGYLLGNKIAKDMMNLFSL